MSKLGFTFYPKDWWTSDTFFDLEPVERYIYLECIFLMYQNDGYIKNDKSYVEKRVGIKIDDTIWGKITQKLTQDEFGLTHKSVNKRLRKAIANRENGKKGGRPQKPKKPNDKPKKNPPLKEKEKEKEKVNYYGLVKFFNDVTGKSIRVVNQKTRKQINDRLKEGYNKEDIAKAIQNCFDDSYHKETNHKYLTLEFITRADKLEKFSSMKPKKELSLGEILMGKEE